MNGIRCPQCGIVNQLSAAGCRSCNYSFANLPPTAYVSVPAQELYEGRSTFGMAQDNELGAKTFFWYRIYLGVMVALYLLFVIGGAYLAIAQPDMPDSAPGETLIMGVIYGGLGLVFVIIYAVALVLPRQPYNWIVGIVMIAIGMTSCCLWPVLIPLLIFWVKPETKAYLGRI